MGDIRLKNPISALQMAALSVYNHFMIETVPFERECDLTSIHTKFTIDALEGAVNYR